MIVKKKFWRKCPYGCVCVCVYVCPYTLRDNFFLDFAYTVGGQYSIFVKIDFFFFFFFFFFNSHF